MAQTPSFSLKSWTAEFVPGGRGPNISIQNIHSLYISRENVPCILGAQVTLLLFPKDVSTVVN